MATRKEAGPRRPGEEQRREREGTKKDLGFLEVVVADRPRWRSLVATSCAERREDD